MSATTGPIVHGKPSGGLALRGRKHERAVLDGLFTSVRAGHSAALVLRGEPGIGKTALLEYAIGSATEMRVLRTAGVESEKEFSFAALYQLCGPILDWLKRLPAPQRVSLETTFGLSAGPAPDRFLVGLSLLSLLSEAAHDRPLLCVVDDAQWLDRGSAQALAFVIRRLLEKPLVLLLGTRDAHDEFRAPELVIEGISAADGREVLNSIIPGRLDEEVAGQLVAETRGNPRALLELPRGLSSAQLAGGFGVPQALPVSARVGENFHIRLAGLPEQSQRLLVVAAAEPMGDPELLRRAGQRLGIVRSALEPAEVAGLIEINHRVRFPHPLVRSAVYWAATLPERRQAHRALAEATDPRVDPDRRAWHMAAAAASPDEAVAAELERAATRAHVRGGLAAAGAFLERAAALTPRPSRRAQRALAAAETKFEAGALDNTLGLLAIAEGCAADERLRGRVQLLRAQTAFAQRRGADAPRLLFRAGRSLERVDPGLARTSYLEALSAGRFAGRLIRGASLVEVSNAALAGPPSPRPPRPPDLLLQGLSTRFARGYPAAAPILKEALSAFSRKTALPPQEARWLLLACRVASDLWDDESLTLLSARELERCREAGALTAIPLALDARSWTHTVSGELAKAELLLEEARTVIEATGVAYVPYAPLWLAAVRGRESEFLRLVETTVSEARSRGEGFALAIAELTSAVLYNGLGRHDAALAACGSVGRPCDSVGLARRPESELIEAAVRCGEPNLAEEALERLAATSRASGTDWALGVEACSRALLSEGERADELYREGITRLRGTRVRLQLARAHLLYGEWLRRQRRHPGAREQLRIAHKMFATMGAEGFTTRAERELLATGARPRHPRFQTRGQLTSQEVQVARLARDGLSNAAIGARLSISKHTVAYHLRKIFVKLGVDSRTQLRQVLPGAPASSQEDLDS